MFLAAEVRLEPTRPVRVTGLLWSAPSPTCRTCIRCSPVSLFIKGQIRHNVQELLSRTPYCAAPPAAYAARTGFCPAACTPPAPWPRATPAGRARRGGWEMRFAPRRDRHSDLPPRLPFAPPAIAVAVRSLNLGRPRLREPGLALAGYT